MGPAVRIRFPPAVSPVRTDFQRIDISFLTSRHPAAQSPTKGTDLELSVLLYVRLPLLGGWLLNDIPRSGFDPIAALVQSITGSRPNGGDSAEAIGRAFEDLWSEVRQKP